MKNFISNKLAQANKKETNNNNEEELRLRLGDVYLVESETIDGQVSQYIPAIINSDNTRMKSLVDDSIIFDANAENALARYVFLTLAHRKDIYAAPMLEVAPRQLALFENYDNPILRLLKEIRYYSNPSLTAPFDSLASSAQSATISEILAMCNELNAKLANRYNSSTYAKENDEFFKF